MLIKNNSNIINNNINLKRNFSEVDYEKSNLPSIKYKRINNNRYIATISTNVPLSYTEDITCKNYEEWEKAIQDELKNLYDNNIFTFVKYIPKGKNIISSMWVFANKYNGEYIITKRKARLVARGFRQRRGIDYDLTYSPTLNTDTLKLFFFPLAEKYKWPIQQLDIKAAYLNADLDKEIYMSMPPGDPNFGRGWWKLNKALYGLKQSGRQWNKTLSKFLIKNRYTQLITEKCIFVKKNEKGDVLVIIGVYVDGMVITGIKIEIQNTINIIKNNFKISKSEQINYILGIEVKKIDNKYIISQVNYINKILENFNIKYTRKVGTPCVADNIKGENNKPFDRTVYKSAIGMLIYLSKCTRPDISFSVHKAARNSENPIITDWIKITNILKYLNNTKYYKIIIINTKQY